MLMRFRVSRPFISAGLMGLYDEGALCFLTTPWAGDMLFGWRPKGRGFETGRGDWASVN